MELMNLNHPASHKCAFCKHWYDPMNQAIRPKAPIVGFWEYDPLAENQCMVRNMKTRGVQSCNQFVCKIWEGREDVNDGDGCGSRRCLAD